LVHETAVGCGRRVKALCAERTIPDDKLKTKTLLVVIAEGENEPCGGGERCEVDWK